MTIVFKSGKRVMFLQRRVIILINSSLGMRIFLFAEDVLNLVKVAKMKSGRSKSL